MHRSPDTSIAGKQSRRDQDVAEDQWDRRVRRPLVNACEPHERRAAVDRDKPRSAHHERDQHADDRYVGDALARIEMALVSTEATGENGSGPPREPATVASIDPERFGRERSGGPEPDQDGDDRSCRERSPHHLVHGRVRRPAHARQGAELAFMAGQQLTSVADLLSRAWAQRTFE
jgi:hypothetical protein